jgi:hypothetical protein
VRELNVDEIESVNGGEVSSDTVYLSSLGFAVGAVAGAIGIVVLAPAAVAAAGTLAALSMVGSLGAIVAATC